MFRFGRSEDVKKISGYTGFKNITFHGGTIDGQGAQHGYKSTLLRFAHASDVTIEDMTLTNTSNSHNIEFAACQNVTINNCVFSDYHGKADSNNEAIQIETLQNPILVLMVGMMRHRTAILRSQTVHLKMYSVASEPMRRS